MADLWLYTPEVCDDSLCPLDCDHCYKVDAAMKAQAEEEAAEAWNRRANDV